MGDGRVITEKYLQLDVFGLPNFLQLETPFLYVTVVGFPGSLFKLRYCMLVSGVEKLLSEVVPLVQPLGSVHLLSILGDEGFVNDLRLLVHELLDRGTTTRLDIVSLMDVFEDRRPDTSLVLGVARGRSVAEPGSDPLNDFVDHLRWLKTSGILTSRSFSSTDLFASSSSSPT